jgi:DNA-binding transcriptional regulator YdaS (Cro superfamily)
MARKSDKRKNPVVERAVELAGGQEQLAEKLGCSQSQVSRMLLCENKVGGDYAIKLEALWPAEFTAAEIVGVEQNPKPSSALQAAEC